MNQHDTLIVVCFILAMLGIVAFGARVLHDEVKHNRKMAKLVAERRRNNR